MNTFSQSVQLLLGLGAEPKKLTFLQVSLRGVIVLLCGFGNGCGWLANALLPIKLLLTQL
jgi:hypothetical protein